MALEYYDRGCENGDFVGCSNLGNIIYNNGDKDKAEKYYDVACELGKNDNLAQNNQEYKKIWIKACLNRGER